METDSHAALNGSQWHFHEFGDLGMCVSLEIGKLDCLSLLRRQMFERPAHVLTSQVIGNLSPHIRTVGSVHARLQFNRLDPAPTAPQLIDRTMMNDAQYP